MNIDERLELLAKIQESHEAALKELFDLHTRAGENIEKLSHAQNRNEETLAQVMEAVSQSRQNRRRP